MPTPPPTRPSPPDRTWPSVTVLIPVHGDRGGLRLTLDALGRQDYPGPVEVVVVDNGDNGDLSAVLPAGLRVRLLAEPRPGSYAARNHGLRHAGGEVLAFTDADCLPRPDWLTAGVGVLLAQPGPAFVGGAIDVIARDRRRPAWAEVYDCVSGLPQQRYVERHGWAATANMLTLRSTFFAVGVFSAEVQSGGDRDWGGRATAAGVAAVFAPGAVVEHPARETVAELHVKLRRITRGEVDARRLARAPMFDRETLWTAVRPNTRSILQQSARVSPPSPRNRLGFVLLAHWLQYAYLGFKVGALLRVRRAGQATFSAVVGPRADRAG